MKRNRKKRFDTSKSPNQSSNNFQLKRSCTSDLNPSRAVFESPKPRVSMMKKKLRKIKTYEKKLNIEDSINEEEEDESCNEAEFQGSNGLMSITKYNVTNHLEHLEINWHHISKKQMNTFYQKSIMKLNTQKSQENIRPILALKNKSESPNSSIMQMSPRFAVSPKVQNKFLSFSDGDNSFNSDEDTANLSQKMKMLNDKTSAKITGFFKDNKSDVQFKPKYKVCSPPSDKPFCCLVTNKMFG